MNTINTITLTDAAAIYIKAQLAKKPNAIGFRLGVKNAGCTNKKYDPCFIEHTEATDHKFTDHGIDIYVRHDDLAYVKGTVIDFVKTGLNADLQYNNPNAVVACGCGESFDITPKP